MKRLLLFAGLSALFAGLSTLFAGCCSVERTSPGIMAKFDVGRDVGDGPSQISLVFATALAAVLAIAVERVPWSSLEQDITTSISKAGVSIMVLFLIGMLSGAWMIGGVMYAGGMLRTIAEVALACVRGVAGLVGATAFTSASR